MSLALLLLLQLSWRIPTCALFLARLARRQRTARAQVQQQRQMALGKVCSAQRRPAVYIVLLGTVAVGGLPGVKSLGQGDFFGEFSLLTGKPSPYACKAKGNVNLYKLNRKVFGKLVKGFPETGKILKATAKQRQGK